MLTDYILGVVVAGKWIKPYVVQNTADSLLVFSFTHEATEFIQAIALAKVSLSNFSTSLGRQT